MLDKINILVRTSYRPKAFARMLNSIKSQDYPNIRVIVSYDDKRALRYIPDDLEKIAVKKDHSKKYFYDEYCNNLKALVTEGFFFFLDDSDTLASNTAISELSDIIKYTDGIICQFSREARLKPSNELIERKEIIMGKVGMPCLVLHHSHKDVADIYGKAAAGDFYWIKKVSEQVKLNFEKFVLVNAGKRDHGKME